jgi:hypothetical protein
LQNLDSSALVSSRRAVIVSLNELRSNPLDARFGAGVASSSTIAANRNSSFCGTLRALGERRAWARAGDAHAFVLARGQHALARSHEPRRIVLYPVLTCIHRPVT